MLMKRSGETAHQVIMKNDSLDYIKKYNEKIFSGTKTYLYVQSPIKNDKLLEDTLYDQLNIPILA